MKLITFSHDDRPSYGAVTADGRVVDLGARLGDRLPTLRQALAAGALAELGRVAAAATPDIALADVAFLPVIPDPAAIIGIGVNYSEHAAEAGRAQTGHPSIFLRLPGSVVGHEQPILRPRVSTDLDFEGELAVIIGRAGRYIPREQALSHIAGYSCFNDASIRDWQRHNPGPTPGKNFYHCGALGPWLVTADEIPAPSALTLETRLNGQQVQHAQTSSLIHDVPAIIAYVSAVFPLNAGDVIATGTPSGVGMARTPPLWMKPGDVIEVTISGIGTLRNVIEDDGRDVGVK